MESISTGDYSQQMSSENRSEIYNLWQEDSTSSATTGYTQYTD